MGLYIPNAKIPVSCNKCYEIGLAHRLRDLGGHCPRMDLHYSPDEQDFKGDRRVDCPLIEIPPHGDLIDRDATRGSIKPWSPEDERNACTFDTVKKLMYTMLDRAPTIIPADRGEEETNE